MPAITKYDAKKYFQKEGVRIIHKYSGGAWHLPKGEGVPDKTVGGGFDGNAIYIPRGKSLASIFGSVLGFLSKAATVVRTVAPTVSLIADTTGSVMNAVDTARKVFSKPEPPPITASALKNIIGKSLKKIVKKVKDF